jgi:hypothetical protein
MLSPIAKLKIHLHPKAIIISSSTPPPPPPQPLFNFNLTTLKKMKIFLNTVIQMPVKLALNIKAVNTMSAL